MTNNIEVKRRSSRICGHKPVLAHSKARRPNIETELTFFSPGYSLHVFCLGIWTMCFPHLNNLQLQGLQTTKNVSRHRLTSKQKPLWYPRNKFYPDNEPVVFLPIGSLGSRAMRSIPCQKLNNCQKLLIPFGLSTAVTQNYPEAQFKLRHTPSG